METMRRYSRRTFVAWVGGASAGFYLFGRLPGTERADRARADPGRHARSSRRGEVRHADADPAGHAEGRDDQAAGRQAGRLLRDLDEADRAADPPGGPSRRRPSGATAERKRRATAACSSTTRPRSRSRRGGTGRSVSSGSTSSSTEAATTCPTCSPSTRPCTGRTRPAAPRVATAGRTSPASPRRAAYTGPVPIVTHVHGAVGVHDDSDGYAEAWYLPAANDIPAGYATEGTWYDFFAGKAAASYGVAWGPGFATFQYPNENRASTIWYHDHALGMTRLNVYAGPAGFYLVRGGPAGDKSGARQPNRPDGSRFPGPAPRGERQVPAEQAVSGDPDRDPGSLVQRGRVALLPRLARVLRRDRRRVHPGGRVLADLEPRVLREHDHGQRQHVAVPRRSSSAATGSASSTAASRAS